LLLLFLSVQLSWSSSQSKFVEIAKSYKYVREIKPNRSPEIDKWNRNVGSPLGASYCGAFVYWCLDRAKIKYDTRKSGLARHLVSKKKSFSASSVLFGKNQIKKNDVLIWQKGESIYGHAGITTADWDGVSGPTIEANTSSGNSGSQSNGNGVFERWRTISPYSYFRIKWITRF